MTTNEKSSGEHFQTAAKRSQSPSLPREFLEFLRYNKKWWLLPILLVLLVFGVLIFLSGTGAAPFIYTFH
jgi:Family of unknown function (DUF5989)